MDDQEWQQRFTEGQAAACECREEAEALMSEHARGQRAFERRFGPRQLPWRRSTYGAGLTWVHPSKRIRVVATVHHEDLLEDSIVVSISSVSGRRVAAHDVEAVQTAFFPAGVAVERHHRRAAAGFDITYLEARIACDAVARIAA
jgi:hypothetical protein